jgi:peptide/nickel transport system substrate-binding protein
MRTTKALLAAGVASLALTASMAHAERASDGQLNIIYWQAPSTMNPYLSGGTKEIEAASMVLEPLASFDSEGNLFPVLAESIPTVENGGVSEDLMSITYTLKEGLLWSDGTPVTAEDAVFSWQYCTNPEAGCAGLQFYQGVTNVEALDERTVKISFAEPNPFPYTALVGNESPVIQKAQFEDCLGARAPECTEENFGPVGTGPFVVTEFRPNDVITLEANQNYRDPSKPAFATVLFKGGGDAASAARSVLETGEFDYAWNLQVEPEILLQMEAAGRGEIISAFATSVERLHLNQTNPSPDLPPERRSAYLDGTNPHPFLTDPAVGQAMSMAIDRVLLTEIGYGPAGQPTCNILPAPELYASTANDACLEQDIEGAKAVLDEAGWVDSDGDGVREKDGVELSVLFTTSTNSVRQSYQSLIKQWWEEIGIETELRNVSASVFFGGDPASPDTFQKLYADVAMWTSSSSGTDPQAYMSRWLCTDIPGPNNQWQGSNAQRFCDPDYEALVAELAVTADINERGRIAQALNDMLVQSYTIVPITWRGGVSAKSNTLGGVQMNDWSSELWNIADWYRID